MTALILIAAAAAATPGPLQAPQPLNARQTWVTRDDIPASARKAGVSGVVNAIVTVAVDGRIIGCTIESSSAVPLNQMTCDLIRKRAKYDPAIDPTGTKVIGVDRGHFAWLLPGDGEPEDRPVQMEVALEAMPKGLPERAYARVDVAVSNAGHVDDCAVAALKDSKNRPADEIIKATHILGDAACAQALKVLKLDPAKDESGKAVPSVQMVTVAFSEKAGARKR